jgi:hypothetical protein
MIKSDRRARIMLGCAMEGGDLTVADLVQHQGAEAAWAKIIEGALGEPAAERAARVSMEVVERVAKAAEMVVVNSSPRYTLPATLIRSAVSDGRCVPRRSSSGSRVAVNETE